MILTMKSVIWLQKMFRLVRKINENQQNFTEIHRKTRNLFDFQIDVTLRPVGVYGQTWYVDASTFRGLYDLMNHNMSSWSPRRETACLTSGLDWSAENTEKPAKFKEICIFRCTSAVIMDSRPAVPQDGWNSPRGSRVGHCDDRIHPRTDNRGLRAHGNAAENAENCAETAEFIYSGRRTARRSPLPCTPVLRWYLEGGTKINRWKRRIRRICRRKRRKNRGKRRKRGKHRGKRRKLRRNAENLPGSAQYA